MGPEIYVILQRQFECRPQETALPPLLCPWFPVHTKLYFLPSANTILPLGHHPPSPPCPFPSPLPFPPLWEAAPLQRIDCDTVYIACKISSHIIYIADCVSHNGIRLLLPFFPLAFLSSNGVSPSPLCHHKNYHKNPIFRSTFYRQVVKASYFYPLLLRQELSALRVPSFSLRWLVWWRGLWIGLRSLLRELP